MKRTKVNIDGMNFFVTGSDDESYVKEMAKDYNQRIEVIRAGNFRLNQVQSLVLTGLNVLDEKNKVEQRLDEVSQSTPEKGMTKEFLEEQEKLQKDISTLEEEKEALKDEVKKWKEKTQEQEKKIKETSLKLNESLSEYRQMKSQVDDLKEKLESEEKRNFEAQKNIVDLNKEISVLSGNEEA